MANVYVRSGAAGAGTGVDWANAFVTLTLGLAGSVAGDSIWVAEDHNVSSATSLTFTSPGTIGNPCFIQCVNHLGSVPPVSADLRTTAVEGSTGVSVVTNVAGGFAYWYGMILQSGTAANNGSSVKFNSSSSASGHYFKNCSFTLATTGGTAVNFTIFGGSQSDSRIICDTCTFTFGSATGQTITSAAAANGTFKMIGGSFVVGANVPTTLITLGARENVFEGVDLSGFGSGKTLVGATAAGRTIFRDCKLGASVTVAATPTQLTNETYVVRSDSGNTNYNQQKYHFLGTQTVETTIVRTGGATDGTTPISWKIVPTANSKWTQPFECIPITIWNNTITPTTFTVTMFGITTLGAVPNNDVVWFDVEGLGTSGFPLGTITTTTKADNLASGMANSSDSSTWGGGTTAFKMVTSSITLQSKGYLNIYPKVVASGGATIYLDPLVVLT